MRRIRPLWIVALALCVACASAEKNAYIVVGTAVTTVDLAMEGYGEAYRAHKTTPEFDAKVRAAYEKYQASLTVLRGAITAYKASRDEASLQAAIKAVQDAVAAIVALTGGKP